MGDYIDRNILKARLSVLGSGPLSDAIMDIVDSAPAADVEPIRRGKWEGRAWCSDHPQMIPVFDCTMND